MDVHILTDLAVKYKTLLLENPEVFILVFALGCTAAWFIVRTRVGNAQAEVNVKKAEIEVVERHMAYHKERAEHFKARLEALEIQNLKTATPPKFARDDPG